METIVNVKRIYKNKVVIFYLTIILCFSTSIQSKPLERTSFFNEYEGVHKNKETNKAEDEAVNQKDIINDISKLKNVITSLVKSNEDSYSERIEKYSLLVKNLFPNDDSVKISKIAAVSYMHTPVHELNYSDIIKKSFTDEKNILHSERNKIFMYKFGKDSQSISSVKDSSSSFNSSFITFFDHDKFVTKRFTVPYPYIKEPQENSDVYWDTYGDFLYLKDFLNLSKIQDLMDNPEIIPKIHKQNIIADYAYFGNKAEGKLFQDKGTHTINGSLYLGFYPQSEGLFILSDGYFYADQIVLGYKGEGSIFQISGSITVEKVLYLGITPSSESLFTLTGGFIKSDALIGVKGTGKFNHVYGVFNSNWISVGFSEGKGFYKLCSGELNSYMLSVGHGANILLEAKNEFTGWKSGYGVLEHSGGTANIDTLSIGVWHSRGTYYLRDEAQLNSCFVYIGNHKGKGEFIHDSGIHTSNSINIGHSGGIGVYEINSGILHTDTIVIGHFTDSPEQNLNGYFIQNGGKIENIQEEGVLWFTIGHKSGKGKYLMNNGWLHTKTANIGFDGSGIFEHKGGDHFSECLNLGLQNGEGIYHLSGGHLRSYTQFIGNKAKGFFIHDKGTNFTDKLHVGCKETGNGIYEILEGEIISQNIKVACDNSNGFFNIKSPDAKLIIQNGSLVFEKKAKFNAVEGSSILLKNSSFISAACSKEICDGTRNIKLCFEMGDNKIELYNESGEKKYFFINSIEIKNDSVKLHIHKLRNIELKIKRIIINKNTSLDLAGNKIYCEELINNGGQINLDGGQIISAPYSSN